MANKQAECSVSGRVQAVLCTEGKVVVSCRCIGFGGGAGDTFDKVALNKAFQRGDVQLRERSRSSFAKNGRTGVGSLAACGERE